MRTSEFWELMEQAFGPGYAAVVASTRTLTALGSRTVSQALEDGERPRLVWETLCVELDLPETQRWLREPPPRG